MTSSEFVSSLRVICAGRPLPKPLHLIDAVGRVRAGESPSDLRKEFRTTAAKIEGAAASSDPITHLLGMQTTDVSERATRRAALILGNLVLGRAAERAFEDLYKSAMGTHEFELRDQRTARSGTDYRVHNGSGRPLYRLNIKFHGSQFRRAPELVGLQPEDSFALATYKIKSALDRQDEEHLPYIFAIVGVPHLTAAVVAARIPTEIISTVAIFSESPGVSGVRDIEDFAVEYLCALGSGVYNDTLSAIEAAPWYVLSARRAFNLLLEKLFDRVYALRVRDFARQFRSAEVDMHFSLKDDLTKLTSFFELLRVEGQTKVASLLERGSM